MYDKNSTKSTDVAEIADRTIYDTLINDHLNNNRPTLMFITT